MQIDKTRKLKLPLWVKIAGPIVFTGIIIFGPTNPEKTRQPTTTVQNHLYENVLKKRTGPLEKTVRDYLYEDVFRRNARDINDITEDINNLQKKAVQEYLNKYGEYENDI